MSPTEHRELMARLLRAYPRQELRDGTLDEYWRGLQDLDATATDLAVSVWIRSERWFPTIADIRQLTLGTSERAASPVLEQRRLEGERRRAEMAHLDQARLQRRLDAAQERWGSAIALGTLDPRKLLREALRGSNRGPGGKA